MKSLIFLIAGFYYVAGFVIRNERIIEGELAAAGQFPYVVSITDENNRHFCGGFIYNDRWIVTTASCVDGKTIYQLKVVVGQVSAINPDPNEESMAVYSIVSFPEYNSTNKMNDIALIKLSKSIQFDYENVDFIVYNQFDFVERVGMIMGWGANMDGGYESVNLRYAAGFIMFTNVSTGCGTYSDSVEFDPAIMMCCGVSIVATPPGSPCMYDEGSPFVQELVDPANSSLVIPTAVGIFSKTPSCELSSRSVYTRLSVYYYWLKNTAGLQPTRPSI
ncbi:chymotrypsinogen A-like [Daphnia pulex]|uniref:chymotrypsinogen A-like n=1 Tax=Daphnia pulex TaxID=6669 RepID=UPI001EDE3538|nr:chymotrypsinogen A-like [Daphnia pulex]